MRSQNKLERRGELFEEGYEEFVNEGQIEGNIVFGVFRLRHSGPYQAMPFG